jgi:hypothetical protein
MTEEKPHEDDLRIRVNAETREILDEIVDRLARALTSKPYWAETLKAELREAAAEVLGDAVTTLIAPMEQRLAAENERVAGGLREVIEVQDERLRGIEQRLREFSRPWYKKLGG